MGQNALGETRDDQNRSLEEDDIRNMHDWRDLFKIWLRKHNFCSILSAPYIRHSCSDENTATDATCMTCKLMSGLFECCINHCRCIMMVRWLPGKYSSTLMMDIEMSSKTLINFYDSAPHQHQEVTDRENAAQGPITHIYVHFPNLF